MKTARFVRPALVVAAVIAVAALSGCASSASSFTGTWGSSASGQPNLTIKDDGSFKGTDGCNQMSGKGTVSGDTFTFGPFATTLVHCAGVNPWLNLAHTAKVDGSTLVVYKNGGEKIGTLDKQ
ncbi:META domain-containing protein [Diaminobutyricibacter sp. McL0618]|jgi:heat shock protein HslJ|uniref:META domain-containing protein n=1 Tax=Leifsonia sp. McL0618 TaxID=3415677 RepID=UPI003CF7A170